MASCDLAWRMLAGLELEQDAVFSARDGPAWQECKQRLQKRGGPRWV